VAPNAANVVPGYVRLTLDLRSDSPEWLERAASELAALAAEVAAAHRVVLEQARELSASAPARCDESLRRCLLEVARAQGHACREMVSGAGHDAAFLALVAPAAMVFVPSRGGLSHTAEEWTDSDQLVRGLQVLLGAVLELDRRT
jgi:N-carbamoyl-L-amino-acid hydrolase